MIQVVRVLTSMDRVDRKLRADAARLLYKAASLVQTTLKERLSVPYEQEASKQRGRKTDYYYMRGRGKKRKLWAAAASKKGEYPRKRTGNLRMSVIKEPLRLAQVMQRLEVRVGYATTAPYGPHLELHMERLGLRDVFSDLSKQLNALTRRAAGMVGGV